MKHNSTQTVSSAGELYREFLELFDHYAADPGRELFLKVRYAFIRLPYYRPYDAGKFDEFNRLVEEGRIELAEHSITELTPAWFLNPSFHLSLARIYQLQGNQEESDTRLGMSQLCLDGIFSTGDGSSTKPYLVTSIHDEYDVLSALDEKIVQQKKIERQNQHLDVLYCASGEVIYFDITDQLQFGLKEYSYISLTVKEPEPDSVRSSQNEAPLYTAGEFLALRASVFELPDFNALDNGGINTASDLLTAGRAEEAYELLKQQERLWILNPRYHQLMTLVFESLGMDKEQEQSARMFRGTLDALINTGNGSRENPYLITRPDDEVDILLLLGEEERETIPIEEGGRLFDKCRTKNNSFIYFDITDAIKTAKRIND